ncbi:hypothetical protein ACKRZS_004168 [Fusarium odoratissimum]
MGRPNRPSVDQHGNRPPKARHRKGLGPTSDSQYIVAGGPSIQKNTPDEPDQTNKKRRQEKGYGDKAGGNDSDCEDSEGSGRGELDGLRYPQHNDPPRKMFVCPFQKYDPARYTNCLSIRASRLSDIMQHIGMEHVLKGVGLERGASIRLEATSVYCTWCRQEFSGLDANRRFLDHYAACVASNNPANIEETGVLVPLEFDELKSEVYRYSVSDDIAKWNIIWRKCFRTSLIPSPYSEMVASRLQAQRILEKLLGSHAADSWSSEETKQAEIDIALSAIYYGESTFDNPGVISSGVADSFVDPNDIDQSDNPLKIAVLNADHYKVHDILMFEFEQVATGEFSWLRELKQLGLSTDEIADELLERSQHGPWIYTKINVLDVEKYHHHFHIPSCLHSRKEDETMLTVCPEPSQALLSIEDSENSVRENIEYLCGIGGVSPMPDGSQNLQFGSVVFEDAHSTAIVSLINSQSVQAVPDVLQHLEKAIGTLQQVGGCCDSFTFLAREEFMVELERIDPSGSSTLESLASRTNSQASLKGLHPQLLDSLTAQFVSLAFALYAQGHCEPFSPFFLDTPLKRVLLIGNQIWGPSFTGPCILASPIELTCFGEMVERRVFTFQYFEVFDRLKVFSDSDKKFDLKAYPEDLLDTWGPGDFIMPKHDSENLHAISIGGGLIVPISTENHQLPALHWSPASECDTDFSSTFPRNERMVIGSRVSMTAVCEVTIRDRVKMAVPWLKELGTFPSYWEVSERQVGLGLQAGQSAVGIVNFAQTWVKRLGQTKKSNILAKRSLSIADLEGLFAVQVSFCTGIARRVRLRELLADILPAYVIDLATQPCHWKNLQACNILQILRGDDFRAGYQKLDRELQAEFETLAIAVLFLLQDTGVDRKGEKFVVGCAPSGLAVHCFKIPIERESFWARILADSEDVATFAYVTTMCFETDQVRCRGPTEPWMNSTSLFSTAVSLFQDGLVTQRLTPQQTRWTLKNAEAYLIGRVDAPLLIRVLRPNIQDEPELLVSMSTIIAPFLRRWSRKQGYKRPWRLRESSALDHQYQVVESVVVRSDCKTS